MYGDRSDVGLHPRCPAYKGAHIKGDRQWQELNKAAKLLHQQIRKNTVQIFMQESEQKVVKKVEQVASM